MVDRELYRFLSPSPIFAFLLLLFLYLSSSTLRSSLLNRDVEGEALVKSDWFPFSPWLFFSAMLSLQGDKKAELGIGGGSFSRQIAHFR